MAIITAVFERHLPSYGPIGRRIYHVVVSSFQRTRYSRGFAPSLGGRHFISGCYTGSSVETLQVFLVHNGVVLLIPINSFLLQGAISSRLVTQVHHDNITVPMVPFLDPGFSGYNEGGDIVLDLTASPWPDVWAQVQNILGSKNAPYAYIGTYEDWYDGQPETFPFTYREDSNYTAYAQGAGFNVSCETSSTLHDFTPSEHHNVTGGRIFSATVGYDLKYPNNMTVDVSWKIEPACVFHMIRKRCTLAAATVIYPIQIQMNIPSSTYTGPFFSLLDGTTRQDDKTVRILPVFQGEGEYNWTYAGIPNLMGGYYNSSIEIIDYLGGVNGSWIQNGPLADALAYFVTATEYYCQIDLVGGLQYLEYLQSLDNPIINENTEVGATSQTSLDIAEVILSRIRQAMFLSSIYMGAEWYTVLNTNFNASTYIGGELPYGRSHYVQELPALRSTDVAICHVRLYLWAISLAITWIVMAIIIPTFWGYRSLTRPASMSPVDIARAFHAPLLAEVSPEHDINRVLQDIGKRNVHQVMVHESMDQRDQESKAEASATHVS